LRNLHLFTKYVLFFIDFELPNDIFCQNLTRNEAKLGKDTYVTLAPVFSRHGGADAEEVRDGEVEPPQDVGQADEREAQVVEPDGGRRGKRGRPQRFPDDPDEAGK
jgi:hypothetical protein